MLSEFCTASLFLELLRELECNQLLLDGVTDGFGVVDSETGKLVSVSPKMLDTFECSDLQGKHLESLVDPVDRCVLANFLGAMGKSKLQVAPVLLTCSSAGVQFDARLVPYKMDGTKAAFCVQLVGEQRAVAQPLVRLPREMREEDSRERNSVVSDATLRDLEERASDLQIPIPPLRPARTEATDLSMSSWTDPGLLHAGTQTETAETREASTQAAKLHPEPLPPRPPARSASAQEPRSRVKRKPARRSTSLWSKCMVHEGRRAVRTFEATP
eukprot:2756306-Amphidinium_carterae.1